MPLALFTSGLEALQKKENTLKQGFGRLVRKESDTGVVAILDSRVNLSGAYRSKVLEALPACEITSQIIKVKNFIRAKKLPAYFEKAGFALGGKNA